MALENVSAGLLNVAYQDAGAINAPVVILLHGFPYDVSAYDEVTPLLVAAGLRVVTPFLRGYGPTKFLNAGTLRSGQQGALGHDLLALMDTLGVQNAILGGYDWGGRAACIVAALWPERVNGLVSCNGYNIQNIASSSRPGLPEMEHQLWYQFYFHGVRGRKGLSVNRYSFCKLLWQLWSPNWKFDEKTYANTAASFENEDFVDVVIHSYRHRYGLVAGDPAMDIIEKRLAKKPLISAPTVAMDGGGDGVIPRDGSKGHERFFSGSYRREVIPSVGHNLPQEAPREFANAVLSLVKAKS